MTKAFYIFAFSHKEENYICVGAFEKKEDADERLAKLKKAVPKLSAAVIEYSLHEFNHVCSQISAEWGDRSDARFVPSTPEIGPVVAKP